MEVFQFHESLLCEGLFHERGIILAGRIKNEDQGKVLLGCNSSSPIRLISSLDSWKSSMNVSFFNWNELAHLIFAGFMEVQNCSAKLTVKPQPYFLHAQP